jgi:peptide/nickel transport system permease protein
VSPWQPFRRHAGLVVALVPIAGFLFCAVFAPIISPYSPTKISADIFSAPSTVHWLGTDNLGRDELSRIIWGSRYTLLSALVSVLLAAAVGTVLGALSAFSGRVVNALIMRSTDVGLAFPALMLAFVLIDVLGTGFWAVSLTVGVALTPVFVRLVATASDECAQADYMFVARVLGYSRLRRLFRHLLPNVAPVILVLITSAFGWAILIISGLDYLGLGVPLPTPSWGGDLSVGEMYLTQAWWLSVAPGAAITVVILCTNYLGDLIGERLGAYRGRARPGTVVAPVPTTGDVSFDLEV